MKMIFKKFQKNVIINCDTLKIFIFYNEFNNIMPKFQEFF